jgi:hypothetical protein
MDGGPVLGRSARRLNFGELPQRLSEDPALSSRNESAVALYERASKAIPRLPLFNMPLSDAPLLVPIERIAAGLGYDLI